MLVIVARRHSKGGTIQVQVQAQPGPIQADKTDKRDCGAAYRQRLISIEVADNAGRPCRACSAVLNAFVRCIS